MNDLYNLNEWSDEDKLWEFLNELDCAWMDFKDNLWAITGIKIENSVGEQHVPLI